MKYQTVLVHIEANIAHLSLNRPDKLNAMNADFWQEFPAAIEDINNNSRARVIIISGEGRLFCSGMDLSVFLNPDAKIISGNLGRRSENLRRTVLQLQSILSTLENIRIPVLVAIHGGCIGAALNLICACDCRYATTDAYFSLKETQLGMTADLGALQRLPHLMPSGITRELSYTGRKMMADEAMQQGLINGIFTDKDTMIHHVFDIAKQIAHNSPLAVTGSKEMLNYSRDHSVTDSLQYMATWQSGMFQADEVMRAFQAKAENKPAEYEDLWPVETSLF